VRSPSPRPPQRNGRRSEDEQLAEETASLAPSFDDGESTVGGGATMDAPSDKPDAKADPSKDIPSLLLLLLLYTLQGVPMGLASAIPVLLQSRGFGFGAKAIFSFAAWPYSLKVLWSPVVDSVYLESVGRRKSWVVPVQIITGLVMLVMGAQIDGEIGPGSSPDIWKLTTAFFALYFLVATQDIAVDGWALTMLRKENVGYASVCNSVGQTAGYITSYALLLALGDAEFCDAHLRAPENATGEPLVTLGGFMCFWGAAFVVVTVLLALLKKEAPEPVVAARPADHSLAAAGAAVRESYHAAWRVVTLPSVLALMAMLVTSRVAFAGLQAGLDLELLQKGVPRQTILLIGLIYTPFEIAFSLFASRWTAGARPLDAFTSTYPFRIAMCLGVTLLVAAVSDAQPGEHPEHSTAWYVGVIALFVLLRLAANVMFVAQMAFFNRIADPAIGGTYMTMLNTVTNLGGMWPGPLSLMTIEALEQSGCYPKAREGVTTWWPPLVSHGINRADRIALDGSPSCLTIEGARACASLGGECTHLADGFALVSLGCLGIGLLWFAFFLPRLQALQARPRKDWLVLPEAGSAEEDATR